ncbi:MAG: hydantoinase/oxoprolinase family protein, partial [Candidatus Rokubacteria bacterium]|nr:hydantoinase/oxoprolinase family protein [Candidatus Rokubacteria bacterium]
ILHGLRELLARERVAPGEVTSFVNGTTLGLNTLIQRSGAPTGLVVTAGFHDVLEIRRLRLPGAPSFYAERPRPLVPRRHVREVRERVLANGRVYRPLDPAEAVAAAAELRAAGLRSVALCFLHAYRNPVHERQAAAAIRAAFPDLYVCPSSEVWPQQREYERALVTAMNAHIGPTLRDYFAGLERDLGALGVHCPVLSTKSNGGVMTARQAARAPVETLLSGPAAGVIAAAQLGRLTGRRKLIALDMGGTSADISIVDGDVLYSTESQVGDFPLMIPAVDVTSIGAGGGSIAWADSSRVLKVGPQSAGAEPGPACYGRGGTEPTVTDAYVLSGLIEPDEFLGGELKLSRELAERALAGLGERLGLSPPKVAAGILRVATANMYAQFLPLMAQHGVDHREFALLAYGGAGPTHAFLLAREVGIRTVVVPPSPGTLCALGCLLADLRADYVRTVYAELNDSTVKDLAGELEALERQAEAWLDEERVPPAERAVVRSADARYKGQSFEVTVRLREGGQPGLREAPELFHARHRAVYGFADESGAVEIINLRAQAIGSVRRPERLSPRAPAGRPGAGGAARSRDIMLDGVRLRATVHRRSELTPGTSIDGPAIVVQYDTTVFVPPGFRITVDRWLNLVGEAP